MRPSLHRRSAALIERHAARHYALSAALFVVCGLALASPWLAQSVTIPWDAKAHFQAQFAFLAHALHSGQSPFWTPNVFDGSPQIADPQSLIFAPPFLLAALVNSAPGFLAEDATVFAMLGAGGLAIIAIFRDRNWHPAGALLAALAFAFGGSAAWRIQHVGQIMSLAWFPLALWSLTRALDRASFAWGFVAGTTSAFLLLGRDQVAFLEMLLLTAYVLARLPAMRVADWSRPIGAGLLSGIAIAAVPLALTFALALQSNRPEIPLSEAVKGSLHPASFLSLASANLFHVAGALELYWGPPSPSWGETGLFIARNMAILYMGALPVMALLILLITDPLAFLRERDARFFTLGSLALALYAVGRYTPVFALFFEIPGVDLFRRPADATFTLCALLAVLAGYAFHRLLELRFPVVRASLVVLLLAAACIGVAIAKDRLALAAPSIAASIVFLALSATAIAFCCRARQVLVALAVVAPLLTLDLAIGNAPNESTGLPPSDYDMLRPDSRNTTIAILRERLKATRAPDRRDRMEFAGLGFAWPNASLVQNFDNDLGYNPIRTALFEAFTGAGDHVALPEQRVFSKAFPSYRSVAADLTGLRFIATGVPVEQIDPHLKPSDLNFVARTQDGYIYENPRALPRVLVATRALDVPPDRLIADGRWPEADYASTVLLDAPDDTRARRPGQARIIDYANTRIEIDADAPDGGWLVLNDVWHPWWHATIDGADAPVLRANGMFRAVAVTPGHHIVQFSFHPIAGLFADLRQMVLHQGSASSGR
jgi:hypothetical protein